MVDAASRPAHTRTHITRRLDWRAAVPRFRTSIDRPDPTRDEVIAALLHADRAQHDELGRTRSFEVMGEPPSPHASPREQAAAPIDLHDVDE
jgi:hypothetical protein